MSMGRSQDSLPALDPNKDGAFTCSKPDKGMHISSLLNGGNEQHWVRNVGGQNSSLEVNPACPSGLVNLYSNTLFDPRTASANVFMRGDPKNTLALDYYKSLNPMSMFSNPLGAVRLQNEVSTYKLTDQLKDVASTSLFMTTNSSAFDHRALGGVEERRTFKSELVRDSLQQHQLHQQQHGYGYNLSNSVDKLQALKELALRDLAASREKFSSSAFSRVKPAPEEEDDDDEDEDDEDESERAEIDREPKRNPAELPEKSHKECKACTYGSHCAHTCDKGKKGAPKTIIPKKRNRVKSSNGQDALQRKQAAMEEKLRREQLKQKQKEERERLKQERENQRKEEQIRKKAEEARKKEEKEKEKAERERERLEQKKQKDALAKRPIKDAEVLIEEGDLAGQPHTLIEPPAGSRPRVCQLLGEEHAEDMLMAISFMSLFGRQLIGLKIDADFLLESLQEGTDSKLHEVFMRLTNAALDAMDQARGGDDVAEERRARKRDARGIHVIRHLSLSAREDGSGSFPLWSMLNSITWPALLSVLLVSMPECQEALEPWSADCAELLIEQEPSRLPLDLKIKLLRFLCDEAGSSPGMHRVLEFNLETQHQVRKSRMEAEALDKKRRLELQATLDKKMARASGGGSEGQGEKSETAKKAKTADAGGAAGDLTQSQGAGAATDQKATLSRARAEEAWLSRRSGSERLPSESEIETEMKMLDDRKRKRDMEFARDMERVKVRGERLGQDRLERVYWHLEGIAEVVLVQEPKRGGWSSYAFGEELETLMSWLSVRGMHENSLLKRLKSLLNYHKDFSQISKATKVKDVSSRAPYNRVSKLPDSSPPIMNVLQQLSLTAAAFEGPGEENDGVRMARENLLNLEGWCRWSYLSEQKEDEEEKEELSVIAGLAAKWQKKRQDWTKRLKQAKGLRPVADAMVEMESFVQAMSSSSIHRDEASAAEEAEACQGAGECEDEAAEERQGFELWAKEEERRAWHLLVSRCSAASVNLAVLLLGDHVASLLRSLVHLRLASSKGLRLRVCVWTEDIKAYAWHACVVMGFKVPFPTVSGPCKGETRSKNGVIKVMHRVRWNDGEEDEWLYLPEEAFQVWRSSGSKSSTGRWVEPTETRLNFLLASDRLAGDEAASKRSRLAPSKKD